MFLKCWAWFPGNQLILIIFTLHLQKEAFLKSSVAWLDLGQWLSPCASSFWAEIAGGWINCSSLRSFLHSLGKQPGGKVRSPSSPYIIFLSPVRLLEILKTFSHSCCTTGEYVLKFCSYLRWLGWQRLTDLKSFSEFGTWTLDLTTIRNRPWMNLGFLCLPSLTSWYTYLK